MGVGGWIVAVIALNKKVACAASVAVKEKIVVVNVWKEVVA